MGEGRNAKGRRSRGSLWRLRVVGGVVSSRGAGSVLQLLANVLLGRTLGAAGAGVFFLFRSWTNVLGTGTSLGLPIYVLRGLSIASARGADGLPLLLRSLGIAALASVAILLPVLLWRGPLAGTFLQDPGLGYVILLAAAAGGCLAAARLGAEALKAVRRPGTGILLEFAVSPAALVLFLGLALVVGTGATVRGAVGAYAAGLAVAAILAIVLASRSLAGSRSPGGQKAREPADIQARPLASFWGIALANTLMATIPYLVLPWYAGPDEIGQFGIAHRLVALSATILAALASHFAPRFAASRAERDLDGLRKEFRTSQWFSAVLFAPFLALFVLFPEPVLRLFGSEFAAAAPLLLILALGRVVNSCLGLCEHMLSMTGHEEFELASAGVAIAAFTAGTLLLGGSHGVAGITWSYAAAFALRSAVSFLLVHRFILRRDRLSAMKARPHVPVLARAEGSGEEVVS